MALGFLSTELPVIMPRRPRLEARHPQLAGVQQQLTAPSITPGADMAAHDPCGSVDKLVCSRALAYDANYRKAGGVSHHWTKESIEARLAYVLDVDEGGSINGKEVQHALRLLGAPDLRGKTILDYCCGTGITAVYLAFCGAHVYAFDASRVAVEIASASVRRSGVEERVHLSVGDARRLSYPDGMFDFVFCRSALHIVAEYLECPVEVARVLKAGGKAVFCEEALGHNPLFELFRYFIRRKWRDCGGRPLTYADIDGFGQSFSSTVVHHFNLLAQGKRVFAGRLRRKDCPRLIRWLLRAMETVDGRILIAAPWLRRFCGSVVIEYIR